MRTDPRTACANADERLGWALLHDFVAHPLMALFFWCPWTVRFHDWTSARAWPRVPDVPAAMVVSRVSRYGVIAARLDSPGYWRVFHGKFSHAVTIKTDDPDEAIRQAVVWFSELAEFMPHTVDRSWPFSDNLTI